MQYEELDIPQAGPRAAQPTSWRQRAHRNDGTGRRMMVIAGGLGAALVLVLAAFSLTGRHSGEVPVVQADPRPLRVKPANPGGLQIANEDLFAKGGDGQAVELGAAPETPNPAALKAQMQAETPPPPPKAVAPASPVAPPQLVAPPVAAAPAAPVARSVPEAKPQEAAPATAAAKPAAPAVGHTIVQLAALPTEDAARLEWKRLDARMGDLLHGRTPEFSKIERDGKTFWRVRVGGFGDVADATGFCEKVRGKGGGCAIAGF